MSEAPIIHWFRRDLRLNDNTALLQAARKGKVLPVFIFDPALLKSQYIGAPRLQFLLNALRALDEALQQHGTRLLIRHGRPQQVLHELVQETSAEAVLFNGDYSPYARQRDEAIQHSLPVPVHIADDALLIPPGAVLKDDGTPYRVYTPFWKAWETIAKPSIIDAPLQGRFHDDHSLTQQDLPTLAQLGFGSTIDLPAATPEAAQHLLHSFSSDAIFAYQQRRSELVIHPFDAQEQPTSYLSPYLRLGIISPRALYWAARTAYDSTDEKEQRKSVYTWVKEIAWREFYAHILHHYPHVMERDFVDTYTALEWREDAAALTRWKEGTTGYPIVDAAMRQLRATGWMPNRARMVVASFLTKDLLIHWKQGERHFMQHLIDGDPASNNGGWQWAAGTGTDAQPYFRIFNPVSQSKKFASPQYLRHWLPELEGVPDSHIHEPWTLKTAPSAYPAPMVDHKEARERTLEVFKAARGDD